MKLKLLTLAFLIFTGTNLFGQCTPDTNITQGGVYPDSATGLAFGNMGTPYSEVVQVRIPADTIYLGLTVPIIDFTIDSILPGDTAVGLPTSFSYACNPGTCVFPGNSNGCILLSANPVDSGTYPIYVYGRAHGNLAGTILELPFVLDYYKIVILGPVGINQNADNGFSVSQNEPNPFETISDINFTSPVPGKTELKIYNLVGKEIYKNLFSVNSGKNTIRMNAADFESGVYFYTMYLGGEMYTRRMIVLK